MKRNLSVELRPQTLDDFIGCGSITGPIKEGLKQGRVDSAYLLSGSPGTGKTSIARAIIRYVNGKLDYYDINEPESANLGADDLRPLIAASNLRPQYGDYKGIILNEAQKIVASTQEILLQAIEEPCPSTIWLLTSSKPDALSVAIRRRCVHYIMPGLNAPDRYQLILKAIKHAGKDIEKKYIDASVELSEALNVNEVTSPGLIVRAVEKFITGVSAEEAAQVSEVTSVDTYAIAKAAAAGKWAEVQTLLATAPMSAARDIRGRVAGFFRSILLKEKAGSNRAERCVWAIQQMTELANQNQFEDGLIWSATCASLYNICIGQHNYITKK